MPADTASGYTVRDLAARYRVSPERVRAWIRSGQLLALNRSDGRCARPSWVVTPEALVAFEQRRASGTPPKPPPRQRRRPGAIDYYPDAAPAGREGAR